MSKKIPLGNLLPDYWFPPESKQEHGTISFTMAQFLDHVDKTPRLKDLWDAMEQLDPGSENLESLLTNNSFTKALRKRKLR